MFVINRDRPPWPAVGLFGNVLQQIVAQLCRNIELCEDEKKKRFPQSCTPKPPTAHACRKGTRNPFTPAPMRAGQ